MIDIGELHDKLDVWGALNDVQTYDIVMEHWTIHKFNSSSIIVKSQVCIIYVAATCVLWLIGLRVILVVYMQWQRKV